MNRDRWCGLSASHWWRLVPPLSTDLLTEFYDDLGLWFLDAATLQSLLRETILEHRDAFRHYLRVMPGEESLPNTRPAALIAAVSRLGHDLARVAGRDLAELFRIWCQDVFTIDADDQPNWFCYEEAFSSWRSNWRSHGIDSLGIGPVCYQNYEAVVDGKALHDAFRRNATQQPSEWDRTLFSITDYTQSDKWQEHETNLYDAIFQTIYRNRFQIFWEATRDTLSDESVNAVYQAAEGVFHEMKAFADKPSLIKPLSLRRKLPLPKK